MLKVYTDCLNDYLVKGAVTTLRIDFLLNFHEIQRIPIPKRDILI